MRLKTYKYIMTNEYTFLLSLQKIWYCRFLARLIEARIERKLNSSDHRILAIVGPYHVPTFNDIFLTSTFFLKVYACLGKVYKWTAR